MEKKSSSKPIFYTIQERASVKLFWNNSVVLPHFVMLWVVLISGFASRGLTNDGIDGRAIFKDWWEPYVCPVKFTCHCKIFEKGRDSISADGSGRDHGVQGQPMAYGTRPSRSARR